MNLATIRPGLATLIASMSGLTTVWEDAARPFGMTAPSVPAFVMLSTVSLIGLGRDECRTAFDADAPLNEELSDTFVGQRTWVVQVRVESEVQTDSGNADTYLEQIREQIRFTRNRATLDAVNVAYQSASQRVNLSQVIDGRMRSIVAADFTFTVATTTTDLNAYGYVATATLVSEITL